MYTACAGQRRPFSHELGGRGGGGASLSGMCKCFSQAHVVEQYPGTQQYAAVLRVTTTGTPDGDDSPPCPSYFYGQQRPEGRSCTGCM